jgi:hypothetical protein
MRGNVVRRLPRAQSGQARWAGRSACCAAQPPEDVVLRAVCSYDGANFFGFQRQARPAERSRTVQGELELALTQVLGGSDARELHLAAAGRTDAGVHATGRKSRERWQLACFDADASCLRRGGQLHSP